MKYPHTNSPLDNFLRDTLKDLDVTYQQSDWSEMEAMLGPAQKPFELNIGKKTILISASVITIAVIGIIISHIHFDASSSEESAPVNTDSSRNFLNAVDTQKTTISNPADLATDSVQTGSSVLVQKNTIVDSVVINQKQDKKQKKNNSKSLAADSSAKTTNIPIPSIDTASKHSVQEIKVATSPTSGDSLKSSAPAKKSTKSKKQKSISVDSSRAKTSAQTKQDSLK
ncbi:MAG: hypothetical protein HY840_08175 [Bacteroidetes bacterium]|nr:hypothetical protein [Bacteroidota bacterium]